MPTELSEGALRLLPSKEEAPKCSSHSRLISADPCGTALSVEAVILVETPLPWPKPALDHPLLEGLSSTMETSLGLTRVLAVVPNNDEPGIGVLIYLCHPTVQCCWPASLSESWGLMCFGFPLKFPESPGYQMLCTHSRVYRLDPRSPGLSHTRGS